jgi:hypothetical protein
MRRTGGCLKWGAIGAGVLVVLVVLGTILSGGRGSSAVATATPGGQAGAPAATQASQPATQAGAKPADATKPAPTKPAPTETPAPKPVAKIGDTVKSRNWEITVKSAERLTGDLVWSQVGNKTAPVGQWFVIIADLKNVGNENFTVNTFDFELKTANGQTYKYAQGGEYIMYAQFKGLQAPGKQIPPGATASTVLLFDIAKGTEGINLVFAQARDNPINVG